MILHCSLEIVIQSKVSQKEKKQTLYINAYTWNLENCTDEPICRAGIEMQMKRMNVWTQEGRGG